jgi:hypothetical protein
MQTWCSLGALIFYDINRDKTRGVTKFRHMNPLWPETLHISIRGMFQKEADI